MKKILLPVLVNILMVLPTQAVPLANNSPQAIAFPNNSSAQPTIISTANITQSAMPSLDEQNSVGPAFAVVPNAIQRSVIQYYKYNKKIVSAAAQSISPSTMITANYPIRNTKADNFQKTLIYDNHPARISLDSQAYPQPIKNHPIKATFVAQSGPQPLTPTEMNSIKAQIANIERQAMKNFPQSAATTSQSDASSTNSNTTQNNQSPTSMGNVQQPNINPPPGGPPPAVPQLNINPPPSGIQQQNINPSSTSTLNATSDLSAIKNSNAAAAAAAQPGQLWNLQKVDIRTLIEQVSKQTGKDFLLDPRVQGKVTLISSTPLSAPELYRVFLSILATHGFAAVPVANNVVKIVPVSEANFQAVPEVAPGQMPAAEEYAVQVIPVQNANALQLVNMLRPLLPESSQIFAYAPSNSIIVTGTTSKVAQIYQIIQSIDQPSASNISIVPLAHASAQDLVNTLKSLLSSNVPNGAQSSLNLAADVGANAILISGPPSERARVRLLIRQLDVSSSIVLNAIAVVHLHYLNAKDLVKELSNLAGGIPAAPIENPNEGVPALRTPAGNSPSSGNPINYNAGMNTENNPLTISLPVLPGGNRSAESGEAGTNPSTKILIQAEEQTNSVIISAPQSQLAQLKAIIMQLDHRPPEVLIEAMIVEVDESTLLQLGVQWGATLPASVTDMADNFTEATGLFGAGVGVGIVDFGRIRAVINYLANDSQSNILSTPSLVVLNNQKALIKIGKQVSFVTGQYATSSAQVTATPFTTTNQEDVALTLNVVPQIGPDGSIRMLIKTGNETLSTTTTNGNPQINEEKLNTSVIMNNNQILILGGLLSNDFEGSDAYVPILGSIPLIGQLFHYHNNTVDKKNLMVFLHPVILSNQGVSDLQTGAKYSLVRELQLVQAQRSNYYSPTDANPVIPQWKPLKLPPPFPS